MKKKVLLSIVIILPVVFGIAIYLIMPRSPRYATSEDLLQAIIKSENIPGEIKELGRITDKRSTLVFAVAGETEQERCPYVAEFLITKGGNYQFVKSYPLYEYAWQIWGCKWNNGYAFICLNPDADSLCTEVTPRSGSKKCSQIYIDEIPWVYHYSLADTNGEYQLCVTFYDQTGQEIK